MGTKLVAQSSQQCVQATTPDPKHLEKTADQPIAYILSILCLPGPGQVAFPRLTDEQGVIDARRRVDSGC